MRRIAIVGVAGCTLIVMICWANEVAVACITDLFPQLGVQADALDRQHRQFENFEQEFGAIAREVALGRRSLRAATSAIEQSALRHYPNYLRQIETLKSGSTVSTKLAGQVLAHLKSMGPNAALQVDSVRQDNLTREFEQMLADEAELPVTNRSNPQVSP